MITGRLCSCGFLMAGALALAHPVHAQSVVVANPESGQADAGTASRPIPNVTANDTINGAAVVLGASGNGSISKLGTWPTGIGLNPTTGAVSTTVAVGPGTYTFTYQLCDKNSPPDCTPATVKELNRHAGLPAEVGDFDLRAIQGPGRLQKPTLLVGV